MTRDAGVASAGHAVAIVPTDFDNHRDVDLLVVGYGGRPSLFSNLRDGAFRDVASETGLPAAGPLLRVDLVVPPQREPVRLVLLQRLQQRHALVQPVERDD